MVGLSCLRERTSDSMMEIEEELGQWPLTSSVLLLYPIQSNPAEETFSGIPALVWKKKRALFPLVRGLLIPLPDSLICFSIPAYSTLFSSDRVAAPFPSLTDFLRTREDIVRGFHI